MRKFADIIQVLKEKSTARSELFEAVGDPLTIGRDEADQTPPSDGQPPEQQGQPPASAPAPEVTYSDSYVLMVKLIVQFFKYNKSLPPDVVKYSEYEIDSIGKAWKFVDFILSRLFPQFKNELYNIKFDGNTEKNDLDESTFIEMTNIAKNALYYVPKENNSEYASARNQITGQGLAPAGIDSQNANRVYMMVSEFVSMETTEPT